MISESVLRVRDLTVPFLSLKVDITWDETDHERVASLSRTFKKDELLDMDFQAYLASSSEEEEPGTAPCPCSVHFWSKKPVCKSVPLPFSAKGETPVVITVSIMKHSGFLEFPDLLLNEIAVQFGKTH